MAKLPETTASTVNNSQVSRADLAKRAIPHMILSNGNPNSLTPAPPQRTSLRDERRPEQRFAVRGNAIVTGGTGVLGFAACLALLEHGLQGLVIFDISPEAFKDQLAELRDRFPSRPIDVVKVDVTDEQAVKSTMQISANFLGSIDHMFCFVGVVGCVESLDMSIQQWRRILDINLTGGFICAQAAAKAMVEQGHGGSITFTASISAHRVNYPQPQAAYNVSKSALLMLKSCLAAEWARYGIRTNTISPGYMDTILNEGDGIAEARNSWCERNPFGRMGAPSELEGVVVLLASEAGSYINGADFIVDGGGVVF